VTIGTSLGNHYQDEHHYQARSFTPFPGFHQSENVEDRRQEFFDPRTDPISRDREGLYPGGYSSKDLDLTGDESSTLLGRAAGNTDLDLNRIKQIDKQIEFETSIWLDPSETSFPTGPGDLPTHKTDQQIREENNALH